MKVQYMLWAVGLLASSAEATRWKEALRAVNDPSFKLDTAQMETPSYHVMDAPAAYAILDETPQYFTEMGSKRKKISYGPYTVPPMDKHNGMTDELSLGVKMPCWNCTITYIHAGLEYPNGSYANANTSLWLHHTVFIDASTPDTVCGSNYYGKGQRWFASGNERTPADLTVGGKIQAGYYVSDSSYMISLSELMNMEMTPQDAIVTVTFEYLPGSPEDLGFWSVRPIWLDIAGCDIESDMPVKSNTTFSYTMAPSYTSQYSGAVLAQGGHIHDGGVNIDINMNNELQCDCVALYGTTPGYIDPYPMMEVSMSTPMSMPMTMSSMTMSSMMNMMDPTKHISDITGCVAPTTVIAPGDSLSVTAYYNLTAHPPMLNWGGSMADIMGISVVYMAENMSKDKMHSYVGDKKVDLGLSMMGGHAYSTIPMTAMTTPMPGMSMSMSGMSMPMSGMAGMSGMSGMGGMSMMPGMSMSGMSMPAATGAAAKSTSTAAAAKGSVAGSVGGLLGGVLAALALW